MVFLSRGRRRNVLLVIIIVLVLSAGAFAGYRYGVPQTGAEPPRQNVGADPAAHRKVRLSDRTPHTLIIPNEVRASLGIRKGDKDVVAIAQSPTGKRPLTLSASTLFDPGSTYRIRARFAPAEVMSIAKVSYLETGGQERELKTGDFVNAKAPLGVFYSVDVGSKKNDLIDALVQLKFDKEILDNAGSSIAIPQALRLSYERNVQTDVNAVNRALKYLETWRIPAEDIDAVYQEAEEIFKNHPKRDFNVKKYDPEKDDKWGKVVLRAPVDGFIVERNVSEKEIVNDSTVSLFQIARADKLLVRANAREEDIKELYEEWKKGGLRWTIHTLGAPDGDGITGMIDEIGMIVDQNQHTVPVKGLIDNPDRALRAGMYCTATIDLPAPKDVVELPAAAVADDGKQAVVFIQTDETKPEFTMRRVVVTHRIENRVFVRNHLSEKERELSPEDAEQGLLPKSTLQLGDRVIVSGLLELKKELEDQEAEKGK